VELVAGDALLAGCQQMDRLEPLVEGSVAVLEHGSDAHRELLAAVAALLETEALDAVRVFLARLGADALEGIDAVQRATMRAHRTFRPQDRFQLLKGCGFIVEVGGVEDGHDFSPLLRE
jgi:hypothetical protein